MTSFIKGENPPTCYFHSVFKTINCAPNAQNKPRASMCCGTEVRSLKVTGSRGSTEAKALDGWKDNSDQIPKKGEVLLGEQSHCESNMYFL